MKDLNPEWYYEQIQDNVWHIDSRYYTTNQKIVVACGDLDSYARAYTPAEPLTAAQEATIEEGKRERELDRDSFDMGLWKPIGGKASTFTVKS